MGMKQDSESIVEIDKDNLDKECIRLPADYRRYAFLAAEAKRDVQEAKAALDVAEAELSRDIRSNPGKYGLEKVTETALKELVLLQDGFKETQSDLFKAQHRAEMCQAVVWALEHKKRSLTLLVDLHGMGYFADVPMSREGKKAVEDMTERNFHKRRRVTTD